MRRSRFDAHSFPWSTVGVCAGAAGLSVVAGWVTLQVSWRLLDVYLEHKK